MPTKKKKLTPEEKRERRIQKKKMKALKNEETKRKIQHDHLTREIRYSQLTLKENKHSWKQLVLKTSLPKQRDHLEFTWQNFERLVDVKDFVISFHMDELDEAEEQYMTSVRVHLEEIERLVGLFKYLVENMQGEFDKTLNGLEEASLNEIQSMKTQLEGHEFHCRWIIYGLEQIRKEYEKSLRGDFVTKVDELTHGYHERELNLKVILEGIFGIWWKDAQRFIADFYDSIKERSLLYKSFFVQDRFIKQKNDGQLLKVKHMQKKLKRMKEKFKKIQALQKQKIYDLKQEKEHFKKASNEMKDILLTQQEQWESRFIKLAEKSGEVEKNMLQFEKKGLKILQMISMCRKLERQEENVVPFPMPKPCRTQMVTGVESLVNEKYFIKDTFSKRDVPVKTEDFKGDIFQKINELNEIFFTKLAIADISRVELLDEKTFLQKENSRLKAKIYEYCKCLHCPKLPPITSNGKAKVSVVHGWEEIKKYSYFR